MTSAVGTNYNQVGTCPHCGAPLYSQSVRHGILPPPVIYSCTCRFGSYVTQTKDNTHE